MKSIFDVIEPLMNGEKDAFEMLAEKAVAQTIPDFIISEVARAPEPVLSLIDFTDLLDKEYEAVKDVTDPRRAFQILEDVRAENIAKHPENTLKVPEYDPIIHQPVLERWLRAYVPVVASISEDLLGGSTDVTKEALAEVDFTADNVLKNGTEATFRAHWTNMLSGIVDLAGRRMERINQTRAPLVARYKRFASLSGYLGALMQAVRHPEWNLAFANNYTPWAREIFKRMSNPSFKFFLDNADDRTNIILREGEPHASVLFQPTDETIDELLGHACDILPIYIHADMASLSDAERADLLEGTTDLTKFTPENIKAEVATFTPMQRYNFYINAISKFIGDLAERSRVLNGVEGAA